MTLTVFDAFCGAGGSSLGASHVPGIDVVMAANHWQKAIDVHQENFPGTKHDCADLSAVDFRRYLPCDIFIASPECTNHSASRGVSRKAQNPSLFDKPDPSAERSRATMWDVHRYIEAHRPKAVVVENVTDAGGWMYFATWLQAFRDAGYSARILSINSMHVPGEVPQSRDRIYVIATLKGIKVDLDLRPKAYCTPCEKVVDSVQVFKKAERVIGRYGQSWLYRCPECQGRVEPPAAPALNAIDWALPSTRIGDRKKALADATLRRIRIGLERYGISIVQGAGQTFERESSGYARVWPADGPMPAQTTTIQHGVTFVETLRNHGEMRPAEEPITTVEANGNHHAVVHIPLVTYHYANKDGDGRRVKPVTEPFGALQAEGNHVGVAMAPMVVETAHTGDREPRSVNEPFRTMTASDDRPLVVDVPEAYYVRNFDGNAGPSMVHPVSKPLGAMTAKDHTSLLVPYFRTGQAKPVTHPAGSMETRDRYALVHPEVALDDCLFRMLEPHEVGRAMAFPDSYRVEGTKKDRVKLYGNAVTPPVMRWIIGRITEGLAA